MGWRWNLPQMTRRSKKLGGEKGKRKKKKTKEMF
jgi:hypothetical protein